MITGTDYSELTHKLLDRSELIQFLAGHFQIEIAVMLDRIAVGVEQRRVPVADRLVPLGAMIRQADVAAGHVELAVVARQDDERRLVPWL